LSRRLSLLLSAALAFGQPLSAFAQAIKSLPDAVPFETTAVTPGASPASEASLPASLPDLGQPLPTQAPLSSHSTAGLPAHAHAVQAARQPTAAPGAQALDRFAGQLPERLKDPGNSLRAWDGPAVRGLAAADEVDPPWEEPSTWDSALPAEPGAPDSLSNISLEPIPGKAYTASPADWRDEIVHSVFMDRYSRGQGAQPRGNPQSGHTWHGGNINGLIDRLDYIHGSGATTILPTSVIMSALGGYHGYWPVQMMAVDPHFGTLADFKRLVEEAHKRGMRVVFDLVLNHVGNVFEYNDGKPDAWAGGAAPRPVQWNRGFKPGELVKNEHFYRRGVIQDWNDGIQAIRGDFPPNLRHFNAENPETQELLIKVAKWWLKETDVDGFRLDAFRHMHPAFRARFEKEIREYAKSLGKENFLLLREISTGREEELEAHMGNGVSDATFNYPAYRRDNAALHGLAPTRLMEESWIRAAGVLGDAAKMLVRFIDNHDVYRFLRKSTPEALLRVAFAYNLFSLGIPMIYYGTEQAFRQAVETMDPEGPHLPADPRNREDMFAEGQYKSESSSGDRFDPGSASYRTLQQLAALRHSIPALRKGEQYVRWSDPSGAGIYAFSRIVDKEEVVVVLNTAGEERSAKMFVDAGLTPPKTKLVDLLEPSFVTRVRGEDGGSKISVRVPPYGVRVLVRRAEAIRDLSSDHHGRALGRRFTARIASIGHAVERQLDVMNVTLAGSDRAFFEMVRTHAEQLLGSIDKLLRKGTIQPDSKLRVSEDDPLAPVTQRTMRIGVYPVAADPFHWAHLLIGLQAIGKLNLDKVVFVMAGDDKRKPEMTPHGIRHALGRAVLRVFRPFFEYSSIAVGTDYDGETNVFRILKLNPDQPIHAYYLVGDDHYRLKDKNGNDDTILKLEKNIKDPALGFDPSKHEVSVAFIEREGIGARVPTPLEVRFLPKMVFPAASSDIRKKGLLSLMPYDAYAHIVREQLGLYGIGDKKKP
jgi:glycosidase